MDKLPEYKEFLDFAFKAIGILVALYIAPIKKSIDNMSGEMKGLQGSVNELNKNVAIMFQKHEIKDVQIETLTREVTGIRERMHDLINNHIVRIQHNGQEIEHIKEAMKSQER